MTKRAIELNIGPLISALMILSGGSRVWAEPTKAKVLEAHKITNATLEKAAASGELFSTFEPKSIPEGWAKPSSPKYQGCEHDIVAEKPANAGAKSFDSPPAAGRSVTEITIIFPIKIQFGCNKVDKAPDCVGSFREIEIQKAPKLRPTSGGNAIAPEHQRIWWTRANGARGDGGIYSTELTIIYIAQYATTGIPAFENGQKETLVLGFKPPLTADKSKGKAYTMTIELTQSKKEDALSAKVLDWKEITQ